jgi:DNA-binding LytR/AlgR family response regulator
MKIKCIIIDDEPLAIKVIENHLKEFQNFEVIQTFNNPLQALSILEKGEVDILFLDINMSKVNGLEFAKTLSSKIKIVITTAFREYALESYELNVLDYLVKPIPFNRFLKTVNKITQLAYLQKGIQKKEDISNDSFIFLKVDKKLVKIKYKNILYVESLKDYIKVFTIIENYVVHKSLSSITEELPESNFIRIHRSYAIAINKVKSIEGNLLEIGLSKIPIGRKYVNHVKEVLLK